MPGHSSEIIRTGPILCFFLTLSGCAGFHLGGPVYSDGRAQLDSLAQAKLAALPEVQNLVLGVKVPGHSLWSSAKARSGKAEGGGSTLFRSASIGKTVMAATVLRLVEQRKLSLDATLASLLPAAKFQGLNLQGGKDVTGAITLRQLLSHTSGLSDYFEDGPRGPDGLSPFMLAMLADPAKTWEPDETLQYVRENLPAVAGPGAKFHYADTNYQLLGLVVEKSTGKNLHEAYREIVFGPLGMSNTWMEFREPPRSTAPVTSSFLADIDLTDARALTADWGGGGLITTPDDLAALLLGIFENRSFLSQATLDQMMKWTPQSGGIYGLGLAKFHLGGATLYGHDGFYRSFALYDPARRVVFTGTLNQAAVTEEEVSKLWEDLDELVKELR